jgi:hypothetical protein
MPIPLAVLAHAVKDYLASSPTRSIGNLGKVVRTVENNIPS